MKQIQTTDDDQLDFSCFTSSTDPKVWQQINMLKTREQMLQSQLDKIESYVENATKSYAEPRALEARAKPYKNLVIIPQLKEFKEDQMSKSEAVPPSLVASGAYDSGSSNERILKCVVQSSTMNLKDGCEETNSDESVQSFKRPKDQKVRAKPVDESERKYGLRATNARVCS